MPGPTATPFGVGVLTNPLTSAMDALTGSLTKLQTTANTATASIDALTGAISGHVAKFVQLYNPAAVIRFEQATRDLSAALGRALLPLLERFTLVVKEIGNAIAGLSPAGNKMIAVMAAVVVGIAAATAATAVFFATMSGSIIALTVLAGAFGTATAVATAGLSLLIGAMVGLATAFVTLTAATGFLNSKLESLKTGLQNFFAKFTGYFEALSVRFDALMTLLQPLNNAMGDLFESLTELWFNGVIAMIDALTIAIVLLKEPLSVFIFSLKLLTRFLRDAAAEGRALLGIGPGKPGSAEGLSVRNVRFGTVEDAWREAMKSAFSLGGGGKPDYAQATASNTSEMVRLLGEFKTELVNGIRVRVIETVGGVARTVSPAFAVAEQLRQLYD